MSTNDLNLQYKEFQLAYGKYVKRTYIRVKKADLEAKMGTDREDIHDALTSNTSGYRGYFTPKNGKYDSGYVAAIQSGDKPAFKHDECTVITLPGIDECGWYYLKPEIYKYADVLAFHPDRYHRKGEFEGKIILDDYVFSATIFFEVRPKEAKAWLEKAKKANAKRLRKEDKDSVLVDYDWWKKIEEQNKTIHKKAKMGKRISNHQQKIELRRKRRMIERKQVEWEVANDKVWLPDDENISDDNVPYGKEYVSAKSYQKVKSNSKKFNGILNQSAEWAATMPWKSTMHFDNLEQRRYQYNETRNQILVFYEQYNINIPTFDEACAKYGNN